MSVAHDKWRDTAKRHIAPQAYAVLARWYSAARKCNRWTRNGIDGGRWLASRERWLSMQRLSAMHNEYWGRRCFVIGNGPSLRKMDLRLLKDEVTIGCNGLFLLFDEIGFLPTFYTVEDRLVAEDRSSVINKIRGTQKVFPRALSYCLSFDEDTTYINFLYDYPEFPTFTDDFAKKVYWGGTVTFLNLELAYFIGCREVYLIGVDHSYNVPSDANGAFITSRETDSNHFHPDYFGPGYRWSFPELERQRVAYRAAKDFFEKNGGAIYNATVGGKLEIFPRREYDEVIDTKRSKIGTDVGHTEEGLVLQRDFSFTL